MGRNFTSLLNRAERALRDPSRVLDRVRQACGAYHRYRLQSESKVVRSAYICGCGHSGTSLVANILASHPDVHAALFETNAFLPPEKLYVLLPIYLEARSLGKPIMVEKTPRHLRFLDRIRSTVDGVRFIVVVRDGRDVTASIANRHGGNFELGYRRWIRDNTVAARERDSPDVLCIRYEDLVEHPETVVARMCSFLEIPYSDELLNYHKCERLWFGQEGVRRGTGFKGTEHAALRNWQVNQPIFDGRGRWQKELPNNFVQRFQEGSARLLMDAFGYS